MEANMAQAAMRKPGEGRTIAVVGDVYRFLVTGEDTNGKYAQWEASFKWALSLTFDSICALSQTVLDEQPQARKQRRQAMAMVGNALWPIVYSFAAGCRRGYLRIRTRRK
jgi:hypothetical protein